MKKLMTLFFVHDGRQVLLGMKKIGFGKGRWNGFGGRVEAGESPEQAARRELFEECGLKTPDADKCGIISFSFDGQPEVLEVHVFRSEKYQGEPRESNEMIPKWFAFGQIPYGQMWPDDRQWLPVVLAGKKIVAGFHFKDEDTIVRHNIIEVENLA